MTRFGLQLPNFTLPVADRDIFPRVKEMAVAAEEAGFSSVWVMDHFWQLPPLGGAEQPMLESYTLLGALAAVTSTVELGTLVTGVTYRNPAVLAKIVTTLDVISQGRAWLGLGAAWYEEEHVGLGVDYPPVKERMERLEEALQICKAMFAGERPTFSGQHYRTEDAVNLPLPIRPGGPKVMVGGGGERKTLRMVAQYADACNVTGTPDVLRHKVEVIHEHCAAVGRKPEDVEITHMSSLFLVDSAEEAEGTREFLRAVVGEEGMEAMVLGDPDEVTAQVQALSKAGADLLIFNMPAGLDGAAVAKAGAVLAAALA